MEDGVEGVARLACRLLHGSHCVRLFSQSVASGGLRVEWFSLSRSGLTMGNYD